MAVDRWERIKVGGSATPTYSYRVDNLAERDSITGADGENCFARDPGAWYTWNNGQWNSLAPEAFPVGSVFIGVVATNPATLLGYGTWAAFGAGRVMVGRDANDADFDTAEETGGAKTVAAAGTNASESAHTHAVTSNVAVADHAAHTHAVTSNVAVADHASHTHTYTDVPNHTHPHNMQGGTSAATTGTNVMGSTATGGSSRAMAIATANPTGGVATGTTAGPSATLTHAVTNNAVTSGNPSAALSHAVTNNAVTSGAGAAHTHTFTGSPTSVVQPFIVVYLWKRTA